MSLPTRAAEFLSLIITKHMAVAGQVLLYRCIPDDRRALNLLHHICKSRDSPKADKYLYYVSFSSWNDKSIETIQNNIGSVDILDLYMLSCNTKASNMDGFTRSTTQVRTRRILNVSSEIIRKNTS